MEFFWFLVIAVIVVVAYRITRSNRGGTQRVRRDKNNPYQGTIQAGNGVSLKYEVSVREKTVSEESSSALLKDATQKKEEKDIEGAISSLREAYKLMAQSTIIYPIETFLRLPLYLQQAGRYAESIVEFEKLLANASAKIAKEFSHVSKQKQNGLAAMERAVILDKMRLAAQRERQFVHAAYYQVLSDANRAVGLKLQERAEELDGYSDRGSWINSVESLLRKAKKENLVEALVNRCLVFARSCTAPALDKLTTDVAALLEFGSNPPVPKNADAPKKAAREQYKRSDEHLQWLGDAVRLHILQAREAWDAGNYDFARQEYQKTAYAMTQIEGQEWAKEKLKEEQAQFAKDDPLYSEIIPRIQARVAEHPGVLQTSIYGDIPYQKEDIGYALYFGALLNDIRREKKDRTYALYLPGKIYEAS